MRYELRNTSWKSDFAVFEFSFHFTRIMVKHGLKVNSQLLTMVYQLFKDYSLLVLQTTFGF